MRARSLLHKTQLEEFAEWLEQRGYTRETPKGDYEVLRMRHDDDRHPLLVYKRDHMPEHLTVHGAAYRRAAQFYHEKQRQRDAVAELTRQAQDWGMYEQENIHNGDPLRPQEERDSSPVGEKD